ncbi:hypothetical protein RRG08_002425, partial [Elysia crispata]
AVIKVWLSTVVGGDPESESSEVVTVRDTIRFQNQIGSAGLSCVENGPQLLSRNVQPSDFTKV